MSQERPLVDGPPEILLAPVDVHEQFGRVRWLLAIVMVVVIGLLFGPALS
jgi:hypothetical protein